MRGYQGYGTGYLFSRSKMAEFIKGMELVLQFSPSRMAGSIRAMVRVRRYIQ